MTIARTLALLCVAVSEVWGTETASCVVQLTRQDAIHLLAEGSVRARNNLSLESSVDGSVIDEATRRISAQLKDGWELHVKHQDDCTVLIYYNDPKRPTSSGISVRANEKKRIVSILQHR